MAVERSSSVLGQLSFFSAITQPPAPDDLDGLLVGPGQLVRRGAAARASVVVAQEWRVRAMLRAFAELDLDGAAVRTNDGTATAVRTEFSAALLPLAERWHRGALKLAPAGFGLDGPRLRWWCLAAGRADPIGYVLGLGANDEQVWSAAGAALAAAGVPGTFVGPRADGPGYRLVGQRRLGRLRELVGDPPEAAPVGSWPGDLPRD